MYLAALGVVPQLHCEHLAGHLLGILFGVFFADADEDEHALANAGDELAVNRHRRRLDALQHGCKISACVLERLALAEGYLSWCCVGRGGSAACDTSQTQAANEDR